MNIAAEIKNSKKKSNYVVSLSFDIPIKSSRSMLDKPISGEFTITPSIPKKNFKLKLGSGKSGLQSDMNKEISNPDSYRPVTSRNEKKSLNKSSCKNYNNTTRHSKNLSFSYSKSPSCVVSKTNKQTYSMNETLNFKAIKKNMICNFDEDITGYTNPSSQLRKQQQQVNKSTNLSLKNTTKFTNQLIKTTPLILMKNNQSYDSLLISEIRKMEIIALQRKERINYEYKKQRILQQASARKIQRAWRNYKTKKLIHTYSQTLTTKNNKILRDGSSQFCLKEKKILNVRSCEMKNGKNQMKRQMKSTKLNFFEQQQTKKRQQNLQAIPKLELKKQLQMQQIKKWQQLIKQLRRSKNVDQVLQKAQQRKKQLFFQDKQRTQGKKITEKDQAELKKEEKLLNTISRISNSQIKVEIQKSIQSLKKINMSSQVPICREETKIHDQKQKEMYETIQYQMQQSRVLISGQIKPRQSNSPIYIQKVIQKLENLKEQKQKQNEQLSKKQIKQQLIIPITKNKRQQKKQKIFRNTEQIDHLQKHSSKYIEQPIEKTGTKPLLQQKKMQVIDIQKQQIYRSPMYIFNRIQELLQCLCYNAREQFSTRQQEIQNVLDLILTQIICEVLIQLKSFKNILKQLKKSFHQGSLRSKNAQQNKPEGICTNMESIKDYLENMVAFVLDQCPNTLLIGLNSPAGYDSLQILRMVRVQNRDTTDSIDSQEYYEQKNWVLPKSIFKRHWQYASQQIYFEKKFDDRQKQLQRTRKLKQITKVYFQVIFDSFNECLDFFRAYGIKGAPYPWQKKQRRNLYYFQTIESIKPLIKMAFKKLSQIATIFCGLLIEDKKTVITQQMAQDIQEQRMNIYLQHQIQSNNYKWSQFRKEQIEVLYLTAKYIEQRLILQLCLEFPLA